MTVESKRVIITNKGFKCKTGYYIGRGSVFGNPYPIKKSKYSNKIYTLEESLILYDEHFRSILYNKHFVENIYDSDEWRKLLIQFIKNNSIQLNCFCTNKIITFDDYLNWCSNGVDYDKLECHGEIIARHLFDACVDMEARNNAY